MKTNTLHILFTALVLMAALFSATLSNNQWALEDADPESRWVLTDSAENPNGDETDSKWTLTDSAENPNDDGTESKWTLTD